VVHVDPGAWLSMPLAMRRALGRDALLYTAGAVVLAAPVAGVVVGASRPRTRRSIARLAAAAAVFTAVSAVLTMVVFGQWATLALVATSHTTMFTVAFALAAFGAFCGALFPDSLDAAACSLIVVLTAAAGLLVAGASFGDLPLPLIDAAITASPLVAMTSSAHIDLSRMAVPYQMSPLAHLQVQYPAWYVACGWYLLFAAGCVVGMRWKLKGQDS
jgi:hypothetical protein